MKRTILLFLTFTFVLNANALISDSLKNKKIEYVFGVGIGVNVFNSNFHDTSSYVVSANRHKFSSGLFYNIDKEWKVYGGVEYYRVKAYQLIFIDNKKLPVMMSHKIDKIKLTGTLYHCMIHDNKSTLYAGIGFGFNTHLKINEESKEIPFRIENEIQYGKLVTTNDHRFNGGLNLSLMYEYKFKKLDVGFKVNFTMSGSESDYVFSLKDKEGVPKSALKGSYSSESMNLETSIFVKF